MLHTPSSAGAVVAGVDGSETASRALQWAVDDAVRRDAVLRVVTAYRPDPLESELSGPPIGQDSRPESRAAALEVVEEAVALVHRLAPCLPTETVLAPGRPLPVLLEQSDDAVTLAIGSRGLGPVRRMTAASVSAQVVARAACPVVVVRESASRTLTDTRIVVGLDGSGSLGALQYAFDQAVRQHCGLTLVHTWQPGRHESADPARDELAGLLAPFRAVSADIDVRRHVVEGPAAEQLVALSHNARLVVVGTRGRAAVTALLLGSVSLAVIRQARCPVAVVRTHPGAHHALAPEAGPMALPEHGSRRDDQHEPHLTSTPGSIP